MKENKKAFRIIQNPGTFGDRVDGYQKALTLIKWGDTQGQYDIREWNEGYTDYKDGISIDVKDFGKLAELINKTLSFED